MDSELVQRLQTQLLDLRTENCDFKEKCKFLESKVKKISDEKEEIEKELKLNQRKTKAFSFLPGQSSRDEIIKLENEIEAKNKALEVFLFRDFRRSHPKMAQKFLGIKPSYRFRTFLGTRSRLSKAR